MGGQDALESLGGDCLAPFGEGDMDSGDRPPKATVGLFEISSLIN